MKWIYLSALFLLFSMSIQAQEKWSLPQLVQYAMDNNITIKQTSLQEKFSALSLRQNKLSQIPNANFSGGLSYSSGRNQDPTTFSLITQSYLSSNMNLQSSVEIFSWFSKRNTIAASEWELQAAKANTDKLKNDISLMIANLYLQALLAKEQIKIADVQLTQSQSQLLKTRKLVDAGSLPELNAAELEAQVARDSANLISSKGNLTQTLLSLKSYLNLDAAKPFEIESPAADKIPVLSIAELQPELVYQLAMVNLPQQKFNGYKLKAAEKAAAAAKADMLPSLSGSAGIGSSYNNRAKQITGSTPVIAAIGKVNVGGTDYNVFPFQPFTSYQYGNNPYFNQLNENFRQSIGLSLSIPLFNGGAARTNWERNKLTVRNLQYQVEAGNQQTKQDIYLAYNNAIVAFEKFNASKKAVESAERSFSFAQKRYEVGMLSTFELISNQNNLLTQKFQYVLNEFDYVFKMKVLEFYRGQGLKF
ncbi:MAG: TolC family protein [Chitinophagaceae bacterium]